MISVNQEVGNSVAETMEEGETHDASYQGGSGGGVRGALNEGIEVFKGVGIMDNSMLI